VRHSNSRERNAKLTRVAASIRRGFTPRSTYRASCLRRNRISAPSDLRGCKEQPTHQLIRSAKTWTTMDSAHSTQHSCHIRRSRPPQSAADRIIADHRCDMKSQIWLRSPRIGTSAAIRGNQRALHWVRRYAASHLWFSVELGESAFGRVSTLPIRALSSSTLTGFLSGETSAPNAGLPISIDA
jgi:hypothetical protein